MLKFDVKGYKVNVESFSWMLNSKVACCWRAKVTCSGLKLDSKCYEVGC